MIAGIRGRAVFAELRNEGHRVRSGPVRMTFCPRPDPEPTLAFAFGRKFGTAVERNRARRRLRAAFGDTWDPTTGPHGAFLLAGNRSVLTHDYQRLRAAVGECLDQLRCRTGGRLDDRRDRRATGGPEPMPTRAGGGGP